MPSRLALALLLATLSAPAPAQQYSLSTPIPLSGAGAWDYLTADSAARRLYVSHTSDVNVLDLDTLKPIATLSGFGYIHDILIATPTLGFLSDGVANQLVVFNPTTLKILQKIPTPADPNSLAYDPLTRRLFIGSRPTRSLIVLNVATLKIEATLPLDGQPRFSAADGHGTIFVAIDDRSEILRIDARTLKITDTWPTAPCRSPSSLVYSPSTLRLFTPCGNRIMAVLDPDSGKSSPPPPSAPAPTRPHTTTPAISSSPPTTTAPSPSSPPAMATSMKPSNPSPPNPVPAPWPSTPAPTPSSSPAPSSALPPPPPPTTPNPPAIPPPSPAPSTSSSSSPPSSATPPPPSPAPPPSNHLHAVILSAAKDPCSCPSCPHNPVIPLQNCHPI
jgi:hypothetical protein